MNKFKNIKFNDLTDDQMGQLSKPDIINKSLAEYVDEINGHTNDIISCKTHSILVTLTTILFVSVFGLIGFLGILPLAYFLIGYFKLKKSIVWHIRAFKSTASMYDSLGYDYLVEKHTNTIENIEDIGELYTFR